MGELGWRMREKTRTWKIEVHMGKCGINQVGAIPGEVVVSNWLCGGLF